MSAIVEKEFDRNLRPCERKWSFPSIALRQRSADHPMILFVLVIATAFMAMAMMPPSGVALASLGVSPAISGPALGTNWKAGLSEIDIACHGQAWGAESAECLATIARESGHADGGKVRVIAGR